MINGKTITETEHGLVRVFAHARPGDLPQGEALSHADIEAALGAGPLNAEDVQQIWTDDLGGMPLPELLSAGYGIAEDEIEAHEHVLEGAMDLHPTVFVIIRSSAFATRPTTLSGDGPLRLIATLAEPDAEVSFEPLPNPDPAAVLQDAPQKKPPSDAAMSGRIATIALLVMALLVVLMIWIA